MEISDLKVLVAVIFVPLCIATLPPPPEKVRNLVDKFGVLEKSDVAAAVAAEEHDQRWASGGVVRRPSPLRPSGSWGKPQRLGWGSPLLPPPWWGLSEILSVFWRPQHAHPVRRRPPPRQQPQRRPPQRQPPQRRPPYRGGGQRHVAKPWRGPARRPVVLG